jgi:hypothetical protein
MIKKDIHQKLSTKIRREQALSRLNSRLSSMIDQGTHWGHKSLRNSWKRLSYPEMLGAFLGSRKGVQIIDPVKTLQATSRFVRLTSSGISESHPHNVTITKEAPNYSR